MEFNEKLQQLRKNKGITQEELAEDLYVSRTAISKWESGRGYPSIDSLKEIATYFSVTIDELLSGEALLDIAEKENRSNLRRTHGMLFGVADILSLLMILLPLYPKTIDGYVYSVNLLIYGETATISLILYWALPIILIVTGIAKLILTKGCPRKNGRYIIGISIGVNAGAVILLTLSRVVYGALFAFILLLVKGLLMLYNS